MADMESRKLRRAVQLTINNICRETLTDVEIFVNATKAFVDESRIKYIDEAYEKLKNRILDIGGEETRRLNRYLSLWKVEQVSDELDWVEFGDRLK